jgi:CHAT domain-containing protein/Tfp pilus assembly protein PilF
MGGLSKSVRRRPLEIRVFPFCALIISISILAFDLKAQDQSVGRPAQTTEAPINLEFNKSLEKELAGGQSHDYQIRLTPGQYLRIVLETKGIDLSAALVTPDHLSLTVRRSTQNNRTLNLTGYAETEGIYGLEIRPLNKDAKSGRYEVKVAELRMASDKERVDLQSLTLHAWEMKLAGQSKLDEALVLAERALKMREEFYGPVHLDVAVSLNRIAILNGTKSNFAVAEQAYQRSLAIRLQLLGEMHEEVGQTYNNLARLYHSIGKFDQARQMYERAIAVWEQTLGEGSSRLAIAINNFGALHTALGDHAKAETLYRRALAILEKGDPAQLDVSYSFIGLARCMELKGDYVSSEDFYRRALAIQEKVYGAESVSIVRLVINFATLFYSTGDYVQAEQLCRRGLRIQERHLEPNHPDLAHTLNTLSAIYGSKGDYQEAEPLLLRVLNIYRNKFASTHPAIIAALGSLGLLNFRKGDYVQAARYYHEALALAEKGLSPDHEHVTTLLGYLAAVRLKNDDFAEAEKLLERVLSLREQKLGPDHPYVARTLNDLAWLSQRKGDLARAESLYQRALAIMETKLKPDNPELHASLRQLAALYRARGDGARAVKFLARDYELTERNLSRNLVTGSERQKLAYLALFKQQLNEIIAWPIRDGLGGEEAGHLAMRALLSYKSRGLDAMTDTLATLRQHAGKSDQALFDRLARLNSHLSFLALQGVSEAGFAQWQAQIAGLEQQRDQLEAELSSRSAEFSAQLQTVSLDAIQSLIPERTALIEFALHEPVDPKTGKEETPRYVVSILAPQGAPRWIDLGEAPKIDHAINEWRQALQDRRRLGLTRLAQTVDQKVMQPVRSRLGEVERLLISPDGMLNLVPFAALVDQRGRYLASRYSFTFLTSGRDLLRLQEKHASEKGDVIIADPSFGDLLSGALASTRDLKKVAGTVQSLPPDYSPRLSLDDVYFQALPGTASEAAELKSLLTGATVLTGELATEKALKGINGPRLLHIATHGFFLRDTPKRSRLRNNEGLRDIHMSAADIKADLIGNPYLRSGLALAGANRREGGDDDGILTSLEAAGLDLRGTKLVALSACNTGVGDVKNGDGVYGLRRALVLAGSESQVMTLWRVSDRGTRDLMIAYYQRLQRGEGRGEALRSVQLQMLKSRRRRHPYYWAGVIQSGEWANLDGRR